MLQKDLKCIYSSYIIYIYKKKNDLQRMLTGQEASRFTKIMASPLPCTLDTITFVIYARQ